jgi:hypothetical protein
VLQSGVDVAARGTERLGFGDCAEATAYLAVEFHHSQVALSLVVRCTDAGVGPLSGHLVTLALQADQQVVGVEVGTAWLVILRDIGKTPP